MPHVTVSEDVNLYYETFGLGDPVVFIHGFAVDHLVFTGMTQYLQDAHQLFLLDNRGSGQSDCPDVPYTVDMMADDVIGFCKRLELERCHFVGHSMGGMILQRLAHRYPQYVRSAVLCSTDVKLDIRYSLTAKARLEFMRANCSPRSLIENAIGWTFSTRFLEQPGMVEAIIELRLANPFPISVAGYRNQLNALINFDSSAWVKQIKPPCLVIGSDEDMIIREAEMRQLASLIPGARYQSVSGAGHAPFVEQPEAFCRLLQDFFVSH